MKEDQIFKNISDEESTSKDKGSQKQKQKDPKKVAAGKASRKNVEKKKDDTSLSFFNDFKTVAGFVIVCFVLYIGWKSYTPPAPYTPPTPYTPPAPYTPPTPYTPPAPPTPYTPPTPSAPPTPSGKSSPPTSTPKKKISMIGYME